MRRMAVLTLVSGAAWLAFLVSIEFAPVSLIAGLLYTIFASVVVLIPVSMARKLLVIWGGAVVGLAVMLGPWMLHWSGWLFAVLWGSAVSAGLMVVPLMVESMARVGLAPALGRRANAEAPKGGDA